MEWSATDQTPHSAAAFLVRFLAPLDLSTEIVAEYVSTTDFRKEVHGMGILLLQHATKGHPAFVAHFPYAIEEATQDHIVNFIKAVIKEATRIVEGAEQKVSKTKRKYPEQQREHIVELQLWHYLERWIIPRLIARRSIQLPPNTIVMELATWESYNHLGNIRHWNHFYLLCRLYQHFHLELFHKYRSGGGVNARTFESTVWAFAKSLLVACDVVSSPDEDSFRLILDTLCRAISDTDPLSECRRRCWFVPPAAATLIRSPTRLPTRPRRLLKPYWTRPETETEVDRQAAIHPFQDFRKPVKLVVLGHCHGDSVIFEVIGLCIVK